MKELGSVLGSLPISTSMKFLRNDICEGCGQAIEVYEVNGEEVKKGCKCIELEFIKEQIEHGKRNQLNRLKGIFDRHSLISKKLLKASFGTYKPFNKTQEYAKRVAVRYVEVFNPNEPRNLMFYGGYGVGKSHLAKSITDGVIDKGYSAIFSSVPKLLTKFRSTYDKNAEFSEEELIEALNTVDLLVLDDLGAEKTTDWALEKLFEIVDYRQGMCTVYTSNLTPRELLEKLGERNTSRILNEDTEVIKMDGDNYRLRRLGK